MGREGALEPPDGLEGRAGVLELELRDGRWGRPLGGRIDELRFSAGQVYEGAFDPPASFAPPSHNVLLKRGPPLLFADLPAGEAPIQLGSRKHLFIDDAIVATMKNGRFVVNPPRKAERVIDRLNRALTDFFEDAR